MQSMENVTPNSRKSRTPKLGKTKTLTFQPAEETDDLDDEVLDELLARIETLESDNTRLRKSRANSKGTPDGFKFELRAISFFSLL